MLGCALMPATTLPVPPGVGETVGVGLGGWVGVGVGGTVAVGVGVGGGGGAGENVPVQVPDCCAPFRVTTQGALVMDTGPPVGVGLGGTVGVGGGGVGVGPGSLPCI